MSLLSLLDGAQDQVGPRGVQGLLVGGLEEAGERVAVQARELVRVVVGAAAARAHRLLDGSQRRLGGRVLRRGQLRHPGAPAVYALVNVARKLADLRADCVHDEGRLGDAPADVGVVGVGRLVLHRAALRHVLGGDLDRALAHALVGGGQQDLEVGEDAEDDRVGARSRIGDREDALLGHGDALE